MKRVAIVQSNYIPWKGYFDLIASVDEFIIYDDVQFTTRDWRNRNKIKGPNGQLWLSIPVGADTKRLIREVVIPSHFWQRKHWNSIISCYSRSQYFHEISTLLEEVYLDAIHEQLSVLNRSLIEVVCKYLNIETRITNSWDYESSHGKTEALVSLCRQAGADEYISGPSARNYIDSALFRNSGLELSWFDYSGYPEYPQLWGDFVHELSILDLLFNCGKNSSDYMKMGRA